MNDEPFPYMDILSLPHHQSATRPHMSLHDRAAQFAPFAALSGYEEMVDEEARITDREISLGESEQDLLDEQFRRLSEMLSAGQRPQVSVINTAPGRIHGNVTLADRSIRRRPRRVSRKRGTRPCRPFRRGPPCARA